MYLEVLGEECSPHKPRGNGQWPVIPFRETKVHGSGSNPSKDTERSGGSVQYFPSFFVSPD